MFPLSKYVPLALASCIEAEIKVSSLQNSAIIVYTFNLLQVGFFLLMPIRALDDANQGSGQCQLGFWVMPIRTLDHLQPENRHPVC